MYITCYEIFIEFFYAILLSSMEPLRRGVALTSSTELVPTDLTTRGQAAGNYRFALEMGIGELIQVASQTVTMISL